MRSWIAVHLSHLSLDTLCPNWPTKAAAVLENGRVQACTPSAAAAGVRLGMRQAGVSALCPHAALFRRDIPLEELALQEAALALLQYTPQAARAGKDTLVLDVGASLSLFGGVRRLVRKVEATLETLGLSARLGLGPTAAGACLLATSTIRLSRTLKLSTLFRRLDTLPCHSLPAARPHQEWLEGIGCHNLGTLRALPRAGLQRRTHQSVLQALDAAYGEAPELHEWIQPPPRFSGRIELMARIEHAAALQGVANRLLERLCGWLAAHHLAVTRLSFLLEHERGRHACPPTALALALGAPAWNTEHLLRLLSEHLHRLELPAPIIAVSLQVTEIQGREPAPLELFPEPGGSAADRSRLLEILVARLGRDHVLQAAPVADHRPEVANRWVPLDTAPGAVSCLPGVERPFWLLERPIPLSIRQHRPYYGSPLRMVHGPERIEDGWWDGPASRDYFIAQSEEGARYWLYQERGTEGGWFLHGLFA